MNRRQRRRAEAVQRQHQLDDHQITAPGRAVLLTIAADLAAADETIRAMTLILPDGRVECLDAAQLRHGARA